MTLDNQHSLLFFLPELTLTVGMVVVILCDITLKSLRNRLNPLLTVFTLVLAAYFTFQLNHAASVGLFHGMLAIDGFAQLFKLFLLLAALLVVLASLNSTELAPFHQGEFFALLLAVTLGMVLLANSTNLAMLYLSLELVSLTSYIMVGYLKTDRLSNEASLKYILLVWSPPARCFTVVADLWHDGQPEPLHHPRAFQSNVEGVNQPCS
jgi:NADH-quinone oxidoreductase subunit N